MKSKLFLLACVLAIFFACKKSNENDPVPPPPVPSGPVREIQLKLTGDISVTESPLGRKANGNPENAKTMNDSTVYAITVYRDDWPVYNGVFNRADSIIMKVPGSGTIRVTAHAFKRGSGGGFYYQFDYFANKYRYDWPLNFLTNRLDTNLWATTFPLDSLFHLSVFAPDGVTGPIRTRHSEIDSYVGEVSFTAATVQPVMNVPMKRMAFGIRYNVTNFNTGGIVADFADLMPKKFIRPADAAAVNFIYTAGEFQWYDSLVIKPVTINLTWEKPDGSVIPLGQKTISFKRNILTTINITLPGDSALVNPIVIDTAWSGTDSFNF